eukprot:comp20951_c0_seq1/m.28011 comp20951_c0_seq1/g.28011  ORF comp20951_c0_seq1/g.28011 comp20951_c0_seq1/m.28011 type:complete len:233 (-) comp20951_c0_seq1:128-826(-)
MCKTTSNFTGPIAHPRAATQSHMQWMPKQKRQTTQVKSQDSLLAAAAGATFFFQSEARGAIDVDTSLSAADANPRMVNPQQMLCKGDGHHCKTVSESSTLQVDLCLLINDTNSSSGTSSDSGSSNSKTCVDGDRDGESLHHVNKQIEAQQDEGPIVSFKPRHLNTSRHRRHGDLRSTYGISAHSSNGVGRRTLAACMVDDVTQVTTAAAYARGRLLQTAVCEVAEEMECEVA